MTDQITQPAEGNPEGTEGQPTTDTTDRPESREARYRVERNQARSERDSLIERVNLLQTRELERLVSADLAEPRDLLTLSGKSIEDFVGEDGHIDPELVSQAVSDVLSARPGLRAHEKATDRSQAQSGVSPAPQASWGSLIAPD